MEIDYFSTRFLVVIIVHLLPVYDWIDHVSIRGIRFDQIRGFVVGEQKSLAQENRPLEYSPCILFEVGWRLLVLCVLKKRVDRLDFNAVKEFTTFERTSPNG